MNNEQEIPEPENPDKYWLVNETMTIDGKRGKAKIKAWYSDIDHKEHRKVINFDPDR